MRLVFAKEASEGQNDEVKAERLMEATGHHLEDVIALLRQRNTSTWCRPWRPTRDRSFTSAVCSCQTDVLTHPRIQFLYPHDFESQRLTNDSTICVVALPVSVDWYSSLEVHP